MGKAYVAGLDDGYEFLRIADFALQALPDLGLCEDGGCAGGVWEMDCGVSCMSRIDFVWIYLLMREV